MIFSGNLFFIFEIDRSMRKEMKETVLKKITRNCESNVGKKKKIYKSKRNIEIVSEKAEQKKVKKILTRNSKQMLMNLIHVLMLWKSLENLQLLKLVVIEKIEAWLFFKNIIFYFSFLLFSWIANRKDKDSQREHIKQHEIIAHVQTLKKCKKNVQNCVREEMRIKKNCKNLKTS